MKNACKNVNKSLSTIILLENVIERKKYSAITYILLLIIILNLLSWFIGRFIFNILLAPAYSLDYLVVAIVFIILYISALIGVILRKVFGNILVIIASIFNIVILFLSFPYYNEFLIINIIFSLIVIYLSYEDYKKVKSFIFKK